MQSGIPLHQGYHNTISAFVYSMKHEIMPLFRYVLMVYEVKGLSGETFSGPEEKVCLRGSST